MIIITIGDELLIGQVINSNAAYIAERMTLAGFPVQETRTIRDDEEEILTAIREGFEKTDLLVLSGGLGPTKDDLTKEVLCKFLNTTLIDDAPSLERIEKIVGKRGLGISESNRSQAEVPKGTVVLPNYNGTAQGILAEQEGKVLAALPGVPSEMMRMLDDELIPRILDILKPDNYILHRVVQTVGIGESMLSDLLEPWEIELPPHIKLAYLPRTSIVRLRLTGVGKDKSLLEREMQEEIDKLSEIAKNYIWSYEDNQLEDVIGELLKKRRATLGIAESCTGGYLSHLITSVPGSSAYFKGSVISYTNEVKRSVLNVREQNLKKNGAVSETVVTDMAMNVMNLLDVDYSIAISGIAGPSGGTEDKPVGTVWIAVATTTSFVTKHFHFLTTGGRKKIIHRAAIAALNMLREQL